MRVLIPGALLSYTGQNWVEAAGATVGDVIDDLEARYPGIRFRMVDEQGNIRRHMRIFSTARWFSNFRRRCATMANS